MNSGSPIVCRALFADSVDPASHQAVKVLASLSLQALTANPAPSVEPSGAMGVFADAMTELQWH